MYFLPAGNEWYKAAFYEPGIMSLGTNANYWLYATRNDTLPAGAIANAEGDATNGPNNVANWADPTTTLGSFTWGGYGYNVSTVGSCGSNSASYYGAYDMNGDVYEWTESSYTTAGGVLLRSYHGGSAFSAANELPSTLNFGFPAVGPASGWWDHPTTQSPSLGFRVAHWTAAPLVFVTVGNPGNPGDARTGGSNGIVSYPYAISQYLIRNDQWAAFLTDVAATNGDPNGLSIGHNQARGGYTKTGSGTPADPYVFGLVADYQDKPVNNVRFDDVCRYCNYLHNGASNGANTEYGAYDMSLSPNQVRLPGALYFLPTDDEWYKAAFYQPGIMSLETNANYWLYATAHDTLPSGAIANAEGDATNGPNNVANWADPTTPLGTFDWGGLSYNVSTVGSCGSNSASYYGAYDMNGNVYEWTETSYTTGGGVLLRSYHGGSCFSAAGELPSTLNFGSPTVGPASGWWDHPFTQSPSLGFRIAEPAALVVSPTTLTISLSGTQLTLSWTGSGFQLQQNPNLSNPTGWTSVPGGTASPTMVTIGSGQMFFRLINP
jgi:formylglycine-generating enzyme required for sulfatase activity